VKRSTTTYCSGVGLSADERVWSHSTFSKNRDRLLVADIARGFFAEVYGRAQAAGLTSDEHFSVDGTLIDAWASQKSFRRKDGSDEDAPKGSGRNAGRNFHGERRCNETHESKTDPEALMFRKSQAHPAMLCYAGQVLMENRHDLVAEAQVVRASGSAERDTAIEMLSELPGTHPVTVGADKAYDTRGFIEGARALNVTPHVAQNRARRGGSALDRRTTRHPGYLISQAHRGVFWMGEDHWPGTADQISGHGACRLSICAHDGSLQPGTDAEPAPSGTPLGESGVGCRSSSHRSRPCRTRGQPPRPGTVSSHLAPDLLSITVHHPYSFQS
jgi:hypothetical protein